MTVSPRRGLRGAVFVVGVLLLLLLTTDARASVEGERAALLQEIAGEPIGLRVAPLVPKPAPKRDREGGGFGLRTIVKAPIVFHRKIISPQDGQNCTFSPSCSTYGLQAIQEYGLLGWVITSDRLLRCHPGNWDQYAHVGPLKRDPLPRRGELKLDGSRALVGGLLSMVPGLGQTVAGSWQDGLYTLATVSLWTFGAVYYARERKPLPAALTGTVAAFFYIGNVYGGARAMGLERDP